MHMPGLSMPRVSLLDAQHPCAQLFVGSRAGKSGLKSASEAVNDVLVVHGFSIGCKADFYILSTFPMVWAASFCAEVVTWA